MSAFTLTLALDADAENKENKPTLEEAMEKIASLTKELERSNRRAHVHERAKIKAEAIVKKAKQLSLASDAAAALTQPQKKDQATQTKVTKKQARVAAKTAAKIAAQLLNPHMLLQEVLSAALVMEQQAMEVMTTAKKYLSSDDDNAKYPEEYAGPKNEANRLKWLFCKLHEPIIDVNTWVSHYEEFLPLLHKASSQTMKASLEKDIEKAKANTIIMQAAVLVFADVTETNINMLHKHFEALSGYGGIVAESTMETNEETRLEDGRMFAKACSKNRWGCLQLHKLKYIHMLLSMNQRIAFGHRTNLSQPIGDTGIKVYASPADVTNTGRPSIATQISGILQNATTSVGQKAERLKPLFIHVTGRHPRSLILSMTRTPCEDNVRLWKEYFDGSLPAAGSRKAHLDNAISSITSHLYDPATVAAAVPTAISQVRFIDSDHSVTINLFSFVTHNAQKKLRDQYYSSLTAALFKTT